MTSKFDRYFEAALSRGITRRRFTAAAVGLGSAAICGVGDALPAPKTQTTPCTFGFGTYGMKSLTTEQAIQAIADIGFDSVMLDCTAGWDADPARMPAVRRAEVRRQLNNLGLKLAPMEDDLHPDRDDPRNAQQEEHLKAVAQLFHDLAPDEPATIETVLGGNVEWPKIKPLFLRRLESWAKLAEACDITLAIKPHSGTSMSRAEQVVEIIRDLGAPPRLKMCYDYSHFVLTEMTLDQTIRTSLPSTVCVVMKDAVMENGKRVFKLPGETGLIDYAALLHQFYAGGYRGDFNCEVSSMIWHKPDYDPIATAKKCYANIAPAFAAAGIPRSTRK